MQLSASQSKNSMNRSVLAVEDRLHSALLQTPPPVFASPGLSTRNGQPVSDIGSMRKNGIGFRKMSSTGHSRSSFARTIESNSIRVTWQNCSCESQFFKSGSGQNPLFQMERAVIL